MILASDKVAVIVEEDIVHIIWSRDTNQYIAEQYIDHYIHIANINININIGFCQGAISISISIFEQYIQAI